MFWLWIILAFVAGLLIGAFLMHRWCIYGFTSAVGRAFGWW